MLNFRLLFILFLLLPIDIFGQESYYTHSNNSTFKSIQVYNSEDIMSEPVIILGSNETITLQFDELADSERSLKYRLIHCNSKWQSSGLLASEYVKGFSSSYIDNYEYAFNTNIPYVNYQLSLPNDLTAPKISGNYVIEVSDEDGYALLYACFYVLENAVSVQPEIKYVTETDINNKNQQVEFTVLHPKLNISDPGTEVNVIIKQNNRRDNLKTHIQPTFINPNKLVYTNKADLIFKGGNEFRYFEATSTRYNTHGIESIRYHAPYYHMVLVPDEPQSKLNYNYRHDVNGKFFIRKQEADQDYLYIESDYVFVHFTLPADEPFFDGRVFLNGDFTRNQYSKEYEMQYDFNEKVYYTNLLLKQGRYDYQYLFLPTGKTTALNTPFENNFFETENQYQIFVYYKSFGDKYERLVGYSLVNANKK